MKPTSTDEVLDLLDAAFASAALGAAMELGLFWILEKQQLDAPGVARALRIPENRCRYWLQLIESVGLLEKRHGGYAPSPTARESILNAYSQPSWALLAQEARERSQGLRNLTPHIREAGSVWAAQGLTPPVYYAQMAEDFDHARRFTRMLYELHQPLADALAATLDLSGVRRLMDLGGGSGVVSLTLLRRHVDLVAVVVDVETVCVAGREIAAETSVGDRLDYHSADFLKDELPSGFDMVLECDVDVYSEEIFRKVRRALKPGGRFVIVDQLAPEEGVAPAARAHWAFHRSTIDPEFRFLCGVEIREMLLRTGFQSPSQRELLPPDGEARRFSAGTVLVEGIR